MASVHPCVSKPSPKSLVQPWLITELKEFKVHRDEIPPDYPYTVHNSGTVRYRIPYFEFHGLGPPNGLDVGSGGDVYIDLTPGLYALWGRSAQGWKRWLDFGEVLRSSADRGVVSHPFFSDYSLWISTRGDHHISWFKIFRGKALTHSTRKWAIQQRLFSMPMVGVRKTEETACREAAAILAQLDNLPGISPFAALVSTRSLAVVPSSSPSSSRHVPAIKYEDLDPSAWSPRRNSSPSSSRHIVDAPAIKYEVLDYKIPSAWSPHRNSSPSNFRRVVDVPEGLEYTIPSAWSPPSDKQLILDHPCNLDPRPVSLIQRQITSSLMVIFVPTLPPEYPYRIDPVKGSYRVPYFQFSGRGPPTDGLDVGTEGDIYLDLTPGAHSLYGKTAAGWMRWSDPGDTLRAGEWPDGDWIVKHPHLQNHALWATVSSTGGSVSWYRGTSSARSARTVARSKGLVKPSILKVKGEGTLLAEASRILEHIFGGEEGVAPSSSKLPLKRKGSPLLPAHTKLTGK